jgi:hypothetical protein
MLRASGGQVRYLNGDNIREPEKGEYTLNKRPGKMNLFKSREPNLVHYVSGVTNNRVPVFSSDHACTLFVDALATTRAKEPFKLIGYVINA